MRVLIVGATGLLGKAIVQTWRVNDNVVGVGSAQADVRSEEQVRSLFQTERPGWTVLAAAYTDVDGCERNPGTAFDVNSRGAENVARAAAEVGSRLMLISTDYVFDGTQKMPYSTDDRPSPINVYGRSKAEAERLVREIVPEHCIVRTSWLFGMGGRCFPDAILRQAQQRREMAVVSDQRGSPTYNRDLARVVIALVQADARGTVHATNEGVCSWFEFAREIIREAGLNTQVLPVGSAELSSAARRPLNSALSPASLHAYGIGMPHWRAALHNYLQERAAAFEEIRLTAAASGN